MPYREHIFGYHFTMPYLYEMFQWHGNTLTAKFWGFVLPWGFYPILWLSEYRTQRKEKQKPQDIDRPGGCSMWNEGIWDELDR
jgi:hypothetical protein